MRKAQFGIWLGSILIFLTYLAPHSDLTVLFEILIYLAGLLLSVWGCTHYARAKNLWDGLGYLGILGIFGAGLIYLIPPRGKTS